jgi:hypothetical protein
LGRQAAYGQQAQNQNKNALFHGYLFGFLKIEPVARSGAPVWSGVMPGGRVLEPLRFLEYSRMRLFLPPGKSGTGRALGIGLRLVTGGGK